MSTLLKVLHEDGRACHGGSEVWHLPQGGQPGEWMPRITPVVPSQAGYDVVTVDQVFRWFGPAIFEVEVRGEQVDSGDKLVVEQARLLRRLPWDDRTARLLGADCAEHVLHLFERVRPNDDRPRRAVEVARRFAVGEASLDELVAARDAALDAEEDAERLPKGVAHGLPHGMPLGLPHGLSKRTLFGMPHGLPHGLLPPPQGLSQGLSKGSPRGPSHGAPHGSSSVIGKHNGWPSCWGW